MQRIDVKALQGFIDPTTTTKQGYNIDNYDVSQLDYVYINASTNSTELKHLLAVLKGGSEGYYPDLENTIIQRLESIDQTYQRYSTSPFKYNNDSVQLQAPLSQDAEQALNNDFKSWIHQMNKPIHQSLTNTPVESIESAHKVNMERLKGNECFKAQEYSEAIHFYTRALVVQKSALVYSNRSLAYLMLKEYVQAELDATQVIELKGDGKSDLLIKGYLRRGKARFAKARYTDALKDFEDAKKMDSNEGAELVEKCLKKLGECYDKGYGSKGVQTLRRMQIEETDSSKNLAVAAEEPNVSKDQKMTVDVIEDLNGIDQDVLDIMDEFDE